MFSNYELEYTIDGEKTEDTIKRAGLMGLVKVLDLKLPPGYFDDGSEQSEQELREERDRFLSQQLEYCVLHGYANFGVMTPDSRVHGFELRRILMPVEAYQ